MKKYNIISNMKWQIFFSVLAVLLLVAACSDITNTQRKYLDMGEMNYVGKMDSLVVLGGENRAVIVAKNTYLRTATKCVIKWVNIEGVAQEKVFDIKDYISGSYTRMPIDQLPEGDYDFYVYTMDDLGNKSITVECHGSSYGERYAKIQAKITVLALTVSDDNTAEITLSSSKMAVKYRLTYPDTNGEEKTIEVKSNGGKITIPNWKSQDNIQFKVVTYLLPTDKLGLDTIVLPQLVQTAKQKVTNYEVDKTKIVPMKLTKYDDDGTSYGAKGVSGLFDNGSAECWGQNISAPGHLCFDLGARTFLSSASIIGRDGYPGWDVVKFELWGRESIADGPDGPTGYYIMAGSRDANFLTEAATRNWKKIGNGWFKYAKPRVNPQTSQCELTEVDHSFKPRYIMLRVMSVLTPDVVPIPVDQYFGLEGGFYKGDGVNNKNRAFCIRELSLKATGVTYVIQ